MSDAPGAIVVGVGPSQGLGGALCRRFAREGLHVYVAGRTRSSVDKVAAELRDGGGQATACVADATSADDVRALFDTAGVPELVVYNAGNNAPGSLVEMEPEYFEQTWRVSCFGGFLVGTEAARRMLPRGSGSILFTGATASVRGRPPFGAFASAKAGLRAFAQTMARDFGPRGIHVGHVVIDGAIAGDKIRSAAPQYAEKLGEAGMLGLDAIADAYWLLHTQERSAWSFELDLRPHVENW